VGLSKQGVSPERKVQVQNQLIEDGNESSSFGELEIEENAEGLIDQNKIVDFNAHSNNVLMQSRS